VTLILSNKDVEQLLTMQECIEALEDAYRELAAGRGLARTRSDCIAPTTRPDTHYSLKSMDGVIPKFGVGAVRINSDIVSMPKIGNNVRRVKVPAAPNDRYVGLVLLFSSENGEPLAILPDGVMQRIRVGATSGLGVKYLARNDAKRLGLFGAGWQAGTQLMAACAVREIESIRCFSPRRERREAFCKEMSAILNIDVVPVDQPEAVLEDADIILCATNSEDAVFFEHWVRPGMHIGSIKKPEIDRPAIRRADRVIIHARDNRPMVELSAELPDAVSDAEGRRWPEAQDQDYKFPTLPDLIAGKIPGRQSDQDVTCFLNYLGLGYQFAAAGSVVYRKAREQGIGHELPTDWFTEDVHP
jgi:ornithine cyclodeaminase/alanine dehydrogenase-like protein (mu-crystallin family)